MSDLKFIGKLIIRFNLKCETGLHIGGTVEGIEIGGIDNPVIKDPLTGIPYIPGSSLKGKLRSLLEWELEKVSQNNEDKAPPHTCEDGEKLKKCPVCRIFGISASAEFGEPTRLTVRDSYPTEETKAKWENMLGADTYTELKTENAIDRITSMANPRPLERVPKDSEFAIEMIYDIYRSDDVEFLKYLFLAMALLEDSSLGGSGSRGSGKVRFINPKIFFRSREYYYDPKTKEVTAKIPEDIKAEELVPKQLYDRFTKIDFGIKKNEQSQDENISDNPQA